MDPRKLRKLLEILSEVGVKEYRTEEIELSLGEVPSEIVEASKQFTMDDYFEEPSKEYKEGEVNPTEQVFTEDQMLFLECRPVDAPNI